jgi:RNA polymerase sigma-B factor
VRDQTTTAEVPTPRTRATRTGGAGDLQADGPASISGAQADLLELAALGEDDPRRPAVRDRVVESHLPLVRHLARRYTDRGEPFDDLVQVGTIGLLKAVDRYDPERGAAFAAFAVPTVLGEIRRHFRDRGWAIRVPRRLQELSRTLAEARAVLTQELGRAPTVDELAERAGVDADTVLEALESAAAYATVPLEGDEDEVPGAWLAEDDAGLGAVENREALRPLLERLPARERRILALRFVRGMSQSQIAAEVGISQMHVSRLLARTLGTLRAGLDE